MGKPAHGDVPRPSAWRALVADDHPSAIMMVTRTIELAGGAIEQVVPDGDALLDAAGNERSNLAVMDLFMPGRDRCLSLLRKLRAVRPALPVIVYSSLDHGLVASAAMQLGASAFVSKVSAPGVLLQAVERVMQGECYLDPSLDTSQANAHPWNGLTESERRIVGAVSRGLSLKSVAAESGRSYSTVAAQKCSALRKLRLRTDADLVSYIHDHGLAFLIQDV